MQALCRSSRGGQNSRILVSCFRNGDRTGNVVCSYLATSKGSPPKVASHHLESLQLKKDSLLFDSTSPPGRESGVHMRISLEW